jgi:hypothetical protein
MDWLQEFDECDNVFDIHGLLLENNRPDYDTVTLKRQDPLDDISKIITRHFGDNAEYVQVVVPNNSEQQETRVICPFLRVFLYNVGSKIPINYKLENILKTCNSAWFSTRCEKALVFGCFSSIDINNFASVPYEFQNPLMTRRLEEVSRNDNIIIAGNDFHLPYEVQLHVLKYCIHPLAEIMKSYWDQKEQWELYLYKFWDSHFRVLSCGGYCLNW